MAIITSQVTIGTTPSILTNVPAGPCQIIVTVSGSIASNTIFLGTSTAVTTLSGSHVQSGIPWVFNNFSTSRAVTLFAVSTASVGVGVAVVTPG